MAEAVRGSEGCEESEEFGVSIWVSFTAISEPFWVFWCQTDLALLPCRGPLQIGCCLRWDLGMLADVMWDLAELLEIEFVPCSAEPL